MKIISFVGTRPEIIKNLAFCRAASLFKDLEFLVIYTGQNFGPAMSDCFFEELEIPLADKNTELDRRSMGTIAQSLLDYISGCIRNFQPEIVISNTDTDTAFYTALAGARLGIPVAHIEGGIRCEARLNPEEINRCLADHLSDWIFAISEEDMVSLKNEGFSDDRLFMLGDVTLDVLKIITQEYRIEITQGDYNLLTIHRRENVDNPERLSAIFRAVEKGGIRTIFPAHPRTLNALRSSGLIDEIQHSKIIEMKNPLSYVEMIRLVAGSRKVISDSGGLRREAYLLNKPVISLVWFIWFKKMHDLGFEFNADADEDRILWAIKYFNPIGIRPPLFGDGRAAQYILKTLVTKEIATPRCPRL